MKNHLGSCPCQQRYLLLAFFSALLGYPSSAALGQGANQLIVFTQPKANSLETTFEQEHLPVITSLAADLDLDLKVINASKGAPPSARLTPLIVFQNYRGRSIFEGRYTMRDKLLNFIRIAKSVPLGEKVYLRKDVPLWRPGRSKIVTPIKITELQGNIPLGFMRDEFEKDAKAAIAAGFKRFQFVSEVILTRSDRLFYMDFHPFRTGDGRWYLSLALFSQFHCVKPVFRQFENPVSGASVDDVFHQAAVILEREIMRQMRESEIGDGFTPIATNVSERRWRELDLDLPEKPGVEWPDAYKKENLPTRWQAVNDSIAGPGLHFRFPPPLDSYSGEVKSFSGQLVLKEPGTLAGSSGWLEVNAGSVTMGDPGLDDAIHKKMLKIQNFPSARFELTSIDTEHGQLKPGALLNFLALGEFEMVGVMIPIQVESQAELLMFEGQPRLQISGRFKLDLFDKFHIEGPDGPAPERNTLNFYFSFMLEAG